MPNSPLSQYRRLVEQCEITHDAAQEKIIMRMQEVFHNIQTEGFFDKQDSGGLLYSLFNRKKKSGTRPRTNGKPNSLYIWGGVGRGKSMLMDIFYNSLPQKRKKRIHFHQFMQGLHADIHKLRQVDKECKDTKRHSGIEDPLMIVAGNIAEQLDILCFDEFQVHDISDAMLLSRLFEVLFKAGMVIVFTSNRPPDELYKDGLQRESFLPFIELVKKCCDVIEIETKIDYRKSLISSLQRTFFYPLGDEADKFINDIFDSLSLHNPPQPLEVKVQGRVINVKNSCRDVVKFTFDELCAQPLGAADYMELAEIFSTFLITDIPQLSPEKRNEAKRFVTLIDVLYEHKVRLICTAAVPPDELYPSGDGSFEFGRTVSRLFEMQSDDWLS